MSRWCRLVKVFMWFFAGSPLLLSAAHTIAGSGSSTQVYTDDFSEVGIWSVSDPARPSPGGVYSYLSDGSYQITPLNDNGYAIAVAPVADQFGNVIVEAAIEPFAFEGGAFMGVVCRLQDPGNFYAFGFTLRGEGRILRVTDRNFTFLAAAPFTLQPNKKIQVTATCDGDNLGLAIDNRPLLTATDTSFSGGSVGLMTLVENSAGVSGSFDDFVLRALDTGAVSDGQSSVTKSSQSQEIAPSNQRTILPGPTETPAAVKKLSGNQALVRVKEGAFMVDSIIEYGDTRPKLVAQIPVAPQEKRNVLITITDQSFRAVLREDERPASASAAWHIVIDTTDGTANCERTSGIFDREVGRLEVWNANGQLVCAP